jgi:hypothetical protein
MVETTAKICSSLAALTGLPESGTAQLVSDAADALTRRADRVSSALELSATPSGGWEWNGFEDFPPNLISG